MNAPGRAITSLPGFHWFGYYDKLQIYLVDLSGIVDQERT